MRKDDWIVKWDSPHTVNIVFKKNETRKLIAKNAMNISLCKFNIIYDSSLPAEECEKELAFYDDYFASTNIQKVIINSPIRTIQFKNIPGSCFSGCIGLREVVLPDTITNIPYRAFTDCVNLEKIIFPRDYIPSSRIREYLPAGCTNLLYNIAYKDEESMVGALAYMQRFYENDLMKQDDGHDGYVGDSRFKAVLKRLKRYVAEHPNCYTIEMQEALWRLYDNLILVVTWPIDKMKDNDFTPIDMLLSGEKSDKQKVWDSLSDEAKQELFVRARYNMVQVCELFANAYDFPYACKCLLDYWIDGNATFKRVDMYKRMARYYARVMTLYAKGSDGYTGAKDEMLGCLQKISDMGYERQAELLQIELERGIAPKDSQSVVKKSCTGTGWFFNSNHVATCWHVIDGCKSISIEVDGVKFPAQVVAKDTANDIAVLRIGQCNVRHTYLPIKARVAKISDKVFTIGYPLASILGQAQKYTEGTVSAVSGIGNDGRYYQISTPIQPGNSGGALVDARGNVVGLTSSALNAIKTATIVGALPQNVNYAIKVRYLVALLEDSSIYFSVDDVAHNDRQQLVEYVSAATVLIIAE
jgi:S1-C subfamily serine protease